MAAAAAAAMAATAVLPRRAAPVAMKTPVAKAMAGAQTTINNQTAGGPGNVGHGKMNACVEKPPHNFLDITEADLQSGVSIMRPQSRQ